MAQVYTIQVGLGPDDATPLDLRGKRYGTAVRRTGQSGKVDVYCWLGDTIQKVRDRRGREVEIDFDGQDAVVLPEEMFHARFVWLIGAPGEVAVFV